MRGLMNKKRFRSILCLLLILLVSTGLLFGCSQRKDEQKVLNVGTNAEFPPFEYIDENGEIDGFDAAVMRAIGEEMGYTVKFTNMEFKSL
ncbi:MAG: transporter substrate-binding domain-containing protein, partial [Lachnospiraceae bacterium]|nr:transporter substrate-binding domain-containing protein [Lachnospiraceae bacterium]